MEKILIIIWKTFLILLKLLIAGFWEAAIVIMCKINSFLGLNALSLMIIAITFTILKS